MLVRSCNARQAIYDVEFLEACLHTVLCMCVEHNRCCCTGSRDDWRGNKKAAAAFSWFRLVLPGRGGGG